MQETVRIDVALIPSEPQFSKIIEASQAITKQFENYNIIDSIRFPPHISLVISIIPREKIELLISTLAYLPNNVIRKPNLIPSQVEMGHKGYVSLNIEITPELRCLHVWIIEAVAKFRDDINEDEPYWLQNSPEIDQVNYHKYGNSYVLDKFNAHFSIAKVDLPNQTEAYKIAKQTLTGLPSTPAMSLDVYDIGMRNEKWDNLFTS